MRKRLAGLALALAIAMVGLPRLIQAQGLTGHISGTVTDSTGGVLPGVTVTIKNVGTGLTRETVTGTDGGFLFPDLLAKVIFDHWQFSGVTTITTGTYGGGVYNYANVPTGTLTGTGAINGGGSRVVITCNPNLPSSERTFERQFRTECIAPPTDQFRLGTATNDEYLGRGYMNWDIAAFKHVPLGGARRLQLRVELYNAFNTDQWTGVNTTASFDYTTGVLTNVNTFGRLTGGHQQRSPHSARRAIHVLTRVWTMTRGAGLARSSRGAHSYTHWGFLVSR